MRGDTVQMRPAIAEPAAIERASFEIIRETLGQERLDQMGLTRAEEAVLLRVIHATADFDFAETLHFTRGACETALDALRSGAHVVCDTTMVASGINKRALARLGCETHVFVADPDVAREAAERGLTRSHVAMERAAALASPAIFAVGNAPTALMRLAEMIVDHEIEPPALTVGVPVGFVNVVEAKNAIESCPVPSIVSRGRKGGSTVAVAIMNALIYQVAGRA